MNIIVMLILVVVNGSYLSYNPTLTTVGLRRQVDANLIHTIDPAIDVDSYSCRVGVQYPYSFLVGREVYFREDQTGLVSGPWLVTDYQHPHHYYVGPKMADDNLLADIDCEQFVHQSGHLFFTVTETSKIRGGPIP